MKTFFIRQYKILFLVQADVVFKPKMAKVNRCFSGGLTINN